MEDYEDLDAVIARVPCDRVKENKGIRDVFRLQVNLVVPNLWVRNGWIMACLDGLFPLLNS